MAKVRFVCLANSFKEGGRCVAGIVLDEDNNLTNDWIRPISSSSHGELNTQSVEHIDILDIVEIDDVEFTISEGYQSENATFNEDSIQIIGTYDSDNLDALCSSDRLIFGNKGKAIAEDDIANHNHSLMFINTNDFEFYQKTYEDNPKSQTRIKFTYNGNQYDLPVTDPNFINEYQFNLNLANDYNTINMTLSIGVEHNSWYYKLVAGIILS